MANPLEDYFWTWESVQRARNEHAITPLHFRGDAIEDGQHDSMRVHSMLTRARVFVIESNVYMLIHQLVDRFLVEQVAELEWRSDAYEREGTAVPRNEVRQYVDRIQAAAAVLPFPANLPFDTCFFLMRPRVRLDATQLLARTRRELLPELRGGTVHMIGFLIDAVTRDCRAMLRYTPPGLRESMLMSIGLYVDGHGWTGAELSGDPWHLHAFVQFTSTPALVSRPRTSTEQYDIRKFMQKHRGVRVPPQPFYAIRTPIEQVQREVLERMAARVRAALSHRFDVRGHERVRIRRGLEPLSDAREAWLKRRGYRIYRGLDALSVEDAARAMARGVSAKLHGEWFAVQATWVKPHVKGPEDAPYVPAIREVQHGG